MVSGNVSPTTAQPQPITTTTSTAQRHHHHPNCTIVTAQQHQSNFHPPLQAHHSSHHHPHQPQPPPQPPSSSSIDHDMMAIRDNDSLDLYFMSPDAFRAAEAIEFIAEHLRNEDQYIQVGFLKKKKIFFLKFIFLSSYTDITTTTITHIYLKQTKNN